MNEEEKIVEQNEAAQAPKVARETHAETNGETAEQFSFDKLKPKIKPIWEVLFLVFLLGCIAVSLYFSFNALSLDMYEYSEKDGGWQLTGFHTDSSEENKVVRIDYVMEKHGVVWEKNEEKPITSVKKYAFCCDNDVEIIYIGKTVTEIEELAFYSCKNLQAVLVDPENPAYLSENGILYNKDKTELILFPISYVDYAENTLAQTTGEEKTMEYTLPETVKKIGPLGFAYAKGLTKVNLSPNLKSLGTLAFFRCESLGEISLPKGLTTIGSDAFSYCKKLTYMYIPASVTEIGHHAFYECSGLSEIDVEMSEEQFKKIDLGDYWENVDLLKKIVIRYEQPEARK
ncbi:MAG: leucine-rich repeat domain-containing protein [Clostridia bacterium]|nr:leucine-rich repeat domain-containing protein [Clostridia bacterium]